MQVITPLSVFSNLGFVLSSSIASDQACWTLSPSPSTSLPPAPSPSLLLSNPRPPPPPGEQGQKARCLLAGTPTSGLVLGAGRSGRLGRLGEQSSFHKQNRGLNSSQRPPSPREDELEVPAASLSFFPFLPLFL